jgi:hypothetical protein
MPVPPRFLLFYPAFRYFPASGVQSPKTPPKTKHISGPVTFLASDPPICLSMGRGVLKRKQMEATYVWQKAAKKETHIFFYLDFPRFFGRFSARGDQKHHHEHLVEKKCRFLGGGSGMQKKARTTYVYIHWPCWPPVGSTSYMITYVAFFSSSSRSSAPCPLPWGPRFCLFGGGVCVWSKAPARCFREGRAGSRPRSKRRPLALIAPAAVTSDKGGRGKKNDESDVHLPQRYKKGSYLLYFIFIFIFIFY